MHLPLGEQIAIVLILLNSCALKFQLANCNRVPQKNNKNNNWLLSNLLVILSI